MAFLYRQKHASQRITYHLATELQYSDHHTPFQASELPAVVCSIMLRETAMQEFLEV